MLLMVASLCNACDCTSGIHLLNEDWEVITDGGTLLNEHDEVGLREFEIIMRR